MDSMTNDESLSDETITAIINGYEQGLDIADLYDQFDGRVDWHAIEAVFTTYEESVKDDDFDHDDDYDVDSALGSIGWGTDEYYEAY
jgi:hypothetical protein